MKQALRKDIIMTVKGTFPRFLSIFFIVALGVAFFAGIRVTKSDMQQSTDRQFDQDHLQDIRILGTMGLTKDDVNAIKKVEGVDVVEPTYYVDAISKIEGREEVLRVMADTKKLNHITVTKGRMPQNDRECLVDTYMLEKAGYRIGETIELFSGDDTPIKDRLKCSKVTIVGTGDTSFFLSRDRGTTNIGNGKIGGFIVVQKSNFKGDVYTQISLTVKHASSQVAYQKNYNQMVEKVVNRIEDISEKQGLIRKEEIQKEARKTLETKYYSEKKKAEKKLSDGKEELEKAKAKIDASQATLDQSSREIKSGERAIQKGWKDYDSGKKQIKNGEKQLDKTEKELEKNEQLLNDQEDKIDAQIAAAGGIEHLPEDMKAQLLAAKKEIQSKKAQVKSAKKQVSSNRATLKKKKRKLEQGRKTLVSKENELKAAKRKVQNGYAQLQKGKREYESGLASYQKAKKKADKELKKAEKLFQEAKEEIETMDTPVWHVLDRRKNQSYVEFGEDAQRIVAIGEVFPMIFFLVAALVSLTTMTRMVEEERTQIGVLKALGYRGIDIAAKYVFYALTATLGGSILGVLVGETLLPRIIITAYGMMYTGVRVIVTPLETTYSFMAAGLAICVTTGATILACIHEVKEKPADLMRPEAPKEGKRILLERVSILWKHLSFTWKATLRNLFRYKKRFLMTIFGISGCMALLLVGFGLKDSIFSISGNQFEHLMKYQMTVGLDEKITQEQEENVKNKLEENSAITKVLRSYNSSVDVEGSRIKTASLLVLENQEVGKNFIRFCDRTTHEKYKLSDDGVIISEKLAKLTDTKLGDEIIIKDGDRHQVKAKVSHITENYMQHYVYMTPKLYEKLYHKVVKYNQYLCKSKINEEDDESNLRGELLKVKGVADVSFVSEIQNEMDDMLNNLNVVILVLIVSAGLLAFVVLYNLNNINITERKGELATLEVLGFYPMETAMYVYRENILLTIIGSIVGLGLGNLLHRYVIITAEVDAIMFGRSIFLLSYVYSLLLTIAFVFVINVMMFYQIQRINMVESLKSTE